MENVIATLKSIVSGSTEKDAEQAIANQFPKISPRSAVNVRKDIQEHIDGVMSEAELKHYLGEYGLV